MVQVDGIEVATYELAADRGAAGTVVMCHGTPWQAQVWAPVAHALAQRYRVLLWDMPGYGHSTMDPEVPVDLCSQMSRFRALLDHWNLDRPHVVAHDIGGAVALGAHLLHHADYASLHLWDIVTLEPWGSPFFSLVAENAEVFCRLPPRLHRALVREYIAGAAHGRLPEFELDMLAAPWTTDRGQAALYRQMAALAPEHTRPLAASLGEVRCRVTLGWGEQDPWIPIEQAHRLREALPGKPALTSVPNTGHLVPLERPDAVAAALLSGLP